MHYFFTPIVYHFHYEEMAYSTHKICNFVSVKTGKVWYFDLKLIGLFGFQR